MSVAQEDFRFLSGFVREQAGIVLEPGKEYLAESRLNPIVKSAGLKGISELVTRIRLAPVGDALSAEVVDAMTTNETSFFRDIHPFDSLRTTVLPEIIERRRPQRSLNIWCGACSSGQEPYSVAMLIRENFPELDTWAVRIVATDLSPSMLKRAREGRFSQIEVNRGLPAKLLVKYFERSGAQWQISDSLRSMVSFQEHNLVGRWPVFAPLDLVMLRNVLIYFDVPTKKEILERVRRTMHPDGYLLLGGSESTLNLGLEFARIPVGRTVWYRRDEAQVGTLTAS